ESTFIYDPATDKWTAAASKLRGDRSDEETWVKLPDGSILSYDVFASVTDRKFEAQRYIPSQDKWVDASQLDVLNPPAILTGPTQGSELGPAFLLPDKRVIFFGAKGNTAIYDPATDVWSAGPFEPKHLIDGVKTQLAATDNPGAMLPNGNVL